MPLVRAALSALKAARRPLIVAGCALQALSVVLFLNPADLASGGVTGLAIILNRVLPAPIPVGIVTLVLNLPLFALGLKKLGGGFLQFDHLPLQHDRHNFLGQVDTHGARPPRKASTSPGKYRRRLVTGLLAT